MGEDAGAYLLDAPHRPLRALSLLSAAMDRLPIDEKKKVEMDKSIILLGDACEACERIFASPVPLVYTRHTARFLSAWLLLLPLGLWESFSGSWNHIALLPCASIVSILRISLDCFNSATSASQSLAMLHTRPTKANGRFSPVARASAAALRRNSN